jgi:hypothetical protein
VLQRSCILLVSLGMLGTALARHPVSCLSALACLELPLWLGILYPALLALACLELPLWLGILYPALLALACLELPLWLGILYPAC